MSALRSSITALTVTLALVPAARAQNTNPTPTAAAFTKDDFEIRLERKDDNDKWIFPTAIEAQYFFNNARCECDTPVALRIDMKSTGVQKQLAANKDGTVLLYSGPANCVESTSDKRPRVSNGMMEGCTLLATLPTLPNLAKSFHEVETTVGKMFASGNPPTGKGCAAHFTQSVWLWVDSDRVGNPDSGIAGSGAPSLAIDYDGEAPAEPANVTVSPGNEALTVKWTRSTVASDQVGSLVFCSRAGLPVFNPSYFTDGDYQSRKTACPKKVFPTTAADTMAFGALDPAFLCSNQLTNSNEWRIKGLQNGILYQVGVAAVDFHGNASPLENVLVQAPVPTVDFYDAYRAAGGEASGCSYGGRASSGGAAVLLMLGLLWRRRR